MVAAELLAQGLSGSQWSGLKKPLRSLRGGQKCHSPGEREGRVWGSCDTPGGPPQLLTITTPHTCCRGMGTGRPLGMNPGRQIQRVSPGKRSLRGKGEGGQEGKALQPSWRGGGEGFGGGRVPAALRQHKTSPNAPKTLSLGHPQEQWGTPKGLKLSCTTLLSKQLRSNPDRTWWLFSQGRWWHLPTHLPPSHSGPLLDHHIDATSTHPALAAAGLLAGTASVPGWGPALLPQAPAPRPRRSGAAPHAPPSPARP